MPTEDFTLRGEHIALHHLLKLTGACASGGQAKQAVSRGEVRVDGRVETRKACKLRAGQTVQLDERTIRIRKHASTDPPP